MCVPLEHSASYPVSDFQYLYLLYTISDFQFDWFLFIHTRIDKLSYFHYWWKLLSCKVCKNYIFLWKLFFWFAYFHFFSKYLIRSPASWTAWPPLTMVSQLRYNRSNNVQKWCKHLTVLPLPMQLWMRYCNWGGFSVCLSGSISQCFHMRYDPP